MACVQKSSRADADLMEIVDYIAVDSLHAAIRWSNDIDRTFQLLARNPLMGEDVSSLQPGTRRQVFGKHLIFYRPTQDGVVIVRVLHGARKIENLRE
jgi:toxin ParE1/3/4